MRRIASILRIGASCGLEPYRQFLWASDYPHHEGTWPHSAEAIERTMPKLSEPQRAKILGLNAARFFKLMCRGINGSLPDRFLPWDGRHRAVNRTGHPRSPASTPLGPL